MGFLQPLLLWGAAAISIPILIHLWHRRRGKKIYWAAMRWLIDKEDQPKKGFKPDHLLLLFLRMIIILLIVFFLSQPYLDGYSDDISKANIHLVEPTKALVNEYRFELEQALSNGEEIYWLDKDLLPIIKLDEINQEKFGKDLALSTALSQLVQQHHQLHLYLSPKKSYMDAPFFLTPVKPKLHLSSYTPIFPSEKYMEIGDSNYLFLNQQGVLEISHNAPIGKKATNQKRPITYEIDLENRDEINNIMSAFQAIREVYRVDFQKATENERADLYFANHIPQSIPSDQLIFISNTIRYQDQKNVYIEPEPFTKEASDLVATGRLPEYILEKILSQKQIIPEIRTVSRQQLEQQFVVDPKNNLAQTGNMNEVIILILLITVIVERVLALIKGM